MSELSTPKAFYFRSGELNFKRNETGKKYYVEGYVATGDLDKGNDIITENGLNSIFRQFEEKNLKLDYEHETLMGTSHLDAQRNLTKMPLGKRVTWERDAKGVKVGWELNPAWKKFDKDGKVTMDLDDVWGAIQGKFLDHFSIGYIPTKTKDIVREGKEIRLLDDMHMLSSALTGTAMNSFADMTRAFAKSLKWMVKNNKEKGENMAEKETKGEGEATEAKTDPKTNEIADESFIEVKNRLLALEKKTLEQEDTIAELKSESESLKNEAAELKSTNAELKSYVEKARQKAIAQGRAEQKSAENEARGEAEGKSLSLDDLVT